jgi:hypothetical protein
MYPPNLDAYHLIYLDRSRRAVAAADVHRELGRSRRRDPARSRLGRAARRLIGVRVATPEPRATRAREA